MHCVLTWNTVIFSNCTKPFIVEAIFENFTRTDSMLTYVYTER